MRNVSQQFLLNFYGFSAFTAKSRSYKPTVLSPNLLQLAIFSAQTQSHPESDVKRLKIQLYPKLMSLFDYCIITKVYGAILRVIKDSSSNCMGKIIVPLKQQLKIFSRTFPLNSLRSTLPSPAYVTTKCCASRRSHPTPLVNNNLVHWPSLRNSSLLLPAVDPTESLNFCRQWEISFIRRLAVRSSPFQ